MGIQAINVGTNPNDGTGDSLRTSFIICNNNFSYLNSVISGNGAVEANSLTISGNVLLGQPLSFSALNANLQYGGTANAYVQMVMQNKSSLTNASTDYVVTADNGNDSAFFGDFGIASSTYYYVGYESILPNDTYLISNGGNLLLNAGSTGKSVKFVAGGSGTSSIIGEFSNTALTVSPTTISSSTSSGALQVAGGAGVGGNLYVGGDVYVTSTTASTGYTIGALKVAGGAGVDGNLYVNGGLYGNLLGLEANATISSANNSIGFSLNSIRSSRYVPLNGLATNVTSTTTSLTMGPASRGILQCNANVTISYDSTIQSGVEKHFYIKNVSSGNVYVTLPNSSNNKASNIFVIAANAIATVHLYAIDTTSANVIATIAND